jgi:hypothetical protein
MVRDTSLDAYSDIKPELGARQKEVLDAIRTLGCPTDREVAKFLGHADPNYVRPRRKELLDAGYITECEKRQCSVTGKTVWSWRIVK